MEKRVIYESLIAAAVMIGVFVALGVPIHNAIITVVVVEMLIITFRSGWSRARGGEEKTEEEKKEARETFKRFTKWLFGGLFVFILVLVIWGILLQ